MVAGEKMNPDANIVLLSYTQPTSWSSNVPNIININKLHCTGHHIIKQKMDKLIILQRSPHCHRHHPDFIINKFNLPEIFSRRRWWLGLSSPSLVDILALQGPPGSFLNNFSYQALDRDNSGYISAKEMRKLSAKLSEGELKALMVKVGKFSWFVVSELSTIF